MAVQFAVLASGSRGNATLIRSGGSALLIDLGLGPRALADRLLSVGSSFDQISTILLTHTHGDHLDHGTIRAMAKRKIVLYCHEGHRAVLGRLGGFADLESMGLVRHYGDGPFLAPNAMRIEPVELQHDGGPTFGFRVEARPQKGKSSVSIGYLADTGCWSDRMVDQLTDVDVLGVEFNHDVEMQRRSPRHPSLIARNLGDYGHLSNEQGAMLVAKVLGQSRPGTLRHLVLLHLSQQCNRSSLALESARRTVRECEYGGRITVEAARQAPAHPNLWVTPARRRLSQAS